MSFEDHTTEASVCPFFYVTFDGLPYIYGYGPNPWTAGFVTFNGYDYTWVDGLRIQDLKQVEERTELWAGIPDSVTQVVQFLKDDFWRHILRRRSAEEELARVSEDVSPTLANIPVDNSNGMTDDSRPRYIGLETVIPKSVSGGKLNMCARGAYGSVARYHVASWDGVDVRSAAGPEVSDHPLVMRDRVMRLWLELGTVGLDGRIQPRSAGPGTDEALQWTGVVRGVTANGLLVQVTASSLITLTDREAGAVLPRGKLTRPDLSKMVVDEYNDLTTAVVELHGATIGDQGDTETLYSFRLQHGYRDCVDIISDLQWKASGNQGASPRPLVSVGLLQNTGGDGDTWVLDIQTVHDLASGAWCPKSIRFTGSFWKELGFDADKSYDFFALDTSATRPYQTQWRAVCVADEPAPLLYLPPRAVRSIVFQAGSTELPPLFASGGRVLSRDGVVTSRHLIAAEEVFECGTGARQRSDGTIIANINKRGAFGSRADEERILRHSYKDEEEPIIQGVAICGEWPRVLLYLLCGGTRADVLFYPYNGALWRGAAGGIPEKYVDVTAFEDLAETAEGSEWHEVFLAEPTKLADIIGPILVAHSAYLCQSAGGQISIRLWATPRADEPIIELDEYDAAADCKELTDDEAIVNVVIAENLGYDHGKGEARQESHTQVEGESAATYGLTTPVVIDCRSIPTISGGVDRARAISERQFSLWARAFRRVQCTFASARSWLVKVGDIVTLNTPYLDTPITGRVCSVAPRWKGGGYKLRATIVEVASGRTLRGYSPCAYVNAFGLSGFFLVTEANYFRAAADGTDAELLDVAGLPVIVYEIGDRSTEIVARVQGLVGNTLEVNVDCSALTPPLIVEPRDYANSAPYPEMASYVFFASTSRPQLVQAAGDPSPYA